MVDKDSSPIGPGEIKELKAEIRRLQCDVYNLNKVIAKLKAETQALEQMSKNQGDRAANAEQENQVLREDRARAHKILHSDTAFTYEQITLLRDLTEPLENE